MAEKAGRDPKTIEVAPQFVVHLGKTREAARERYRESQMSKHLVFAVEINAQGAEGKLWRIST